MSKLLIRPHEPDSMGAICQISPQTAGWKYVGFGVYRLRAEQSLAQPKSDKETCIVILSGHANIHVGNQLFTQLGQRQSVFEDVPPHCLYVPQGQEFRITAIREGVEFALCTAPGGGDRRPYLIPPAQVTTEERGAGTNTRFVRGILTPDADAESLLIYEVITPGGHWSSYPPHKHDTDNLPHESALEETYFHKMNPPQGFAFQRVYTDERDIDETMTVHNNDLVLVPRGYHPVGAPHGYDLYYLNVMAGSKREWVFKNDEAHEWMLEK